MSKPAMYRVKVKATLYVCATTKQSAQTIALEAIEQKHLDECKVELATVRTLAEDSKWGEQLPFIMGDHGLHLGSERCEQLVKDSGD